MVPASRARASGVGMSRRSFLLLGACALGGGLVSLALPAFALRRAGTLGAVAWWLGEQPPAGWMFCEGQTLVIRKHLALYALLGNRYGGDGRETFCLPDARDPEKPGFHKGVGASGPLKAIICIAGLFPART